MPPTPLFAGRVEGGRIHLEKPQLWRALLERNEGQEVGLSLTRRRKDRSLPQNAYYWGVVVAMLAEHCGYLPEEVHDALKAKFLMDHSGELPRIKSTTALDTKEFGEYVDRCIQLAAELGIVVPSPLFQGEMA